MRYIARGILALAAGSVVSFSTVLAAPPGASAAPGLTAIFTMIWN